MRHVSLVSALLVFSLASCAVEDEPEAPALSEETQELTGPHTVYLNFDGGTYTDCDYCSLSASNRSWVVGTVFKQQSVTLAPAWAGNTARRNAVLSYLRNVYAPYNLVFTTTRPASGNYTMVVFTRDDLRADIAGYS